MSDRMRIARAYEAALFAGRMDEVARCLSDDVTYWVAGRPPIGGEWRGRDAVLRAFERREFGLGPAAGGYEDVERTRTSRRTTGSSSRFGSEAGSRAPPTTCSTSAPAW